MNSFYRGYRCGSWHQDTLLDTTESVLHQHPLYTPGGSRPIAISGLGASTSTRNKDATNGAPGIATRHQKLPTGRPWPYYERSDRTLRGPGRSGRSGAPRTSTDPTNPLTAFAVAFAVAVHLGTGGCAR